MTNQIKTGRKRTILISISILIVSLHTMYYFHSMRPEIETKKLIQQIVRFGLTVGLLVFVYQGRKWARVISLILFSLAILGGLFGILAIEGGTFIGKLPLIVMTLIYSTALCFFGFANSFKAFAAYQRSEKNEVEAEE